ncbi:MAG: rRNA maturation RNase YbeY [Polyangiales bacterium]
MRAIASAPSSATIRARLSKMLRSLQLNNAEVSVVLTDDKEIQQLNRDYRGINRATDVLSFSMREGVGADVAGETLGDLVVSLQRARAQARAGRRSLRDETTLLLAHGLLHLLGWDHRTKTEDRRMRVKCDELCVIAGGLPLFSMGGVDDNGRVTPIKSASRVVTATRKKKSVREK